MFCILLPFTILAFSRRAKVIINSVVIIIIILYLKQTPSLRAHKYNNVMLLYCLLSHLRPTTATLAIVGPLDVADHYQLNIC